MTLYITGGHLTPALAVIDEIQKSHPKIRVLFIGREQSQSGLQRSHEREEMLKRKIPFFPIEAAKFHRTEWWKNCIEILKLPLSFFQVFQLFKQKNPDVILSFGGYVALPVCIIGKFFQATVITHEQTKAAGLANQVIAQVADTIAVANEESMRYFPKEKTVLTGNPIRHSLFRTYKTAPVWLADIPKTKPLMYITGGSQGSHIMNQTIAALLPKLVRKYVVIHQCGTSLDQRTYHDLISERSKLPEELQSSYIVREWVEAKEVSYLFRTAKFIISRAGANTVEELMLAGTPAIFIPLAFAYNDEQYKNAVPLVQAGSALLLLQKDLVPETLYEKIGELERKYERLSKNAIQLKEHMITDGTKRLIQLLLR